LRRRLRLVAKNGFYAVIVLLLRLILGVLFRLRVKGRANVKRDEGYIAVARHRSYWDIPLLVAAMGIRNRVHFISRKGLMKSNPLVQPLIRVYSTIIDRENFGRSDFRRMLDAVKTERLVAIFPEGTTRQRVDAKAGAVYFAALSGKAIVPVNIRPEGAYPPKSPFGLPRITVSIGAPVTVEALEGEVGGDEPRSQKLRAMSDRLMECVDRA
jgi:1-acyl-sn-glycerol-3-phosphate acyltransferase